MNRQQPLSSCRFFGLLFLSALTSLSGCDDGGSVQAEPQATGGAPTTAPIGNQGGATQTSRSSSPTTCGADGTCATSGGASSCDGLADSYCVPNCLVSSAEATGAVCVDTRWSCPAGYVSADQCPVGSCATTYKLCCNADTGERTAAECGTDGLLTACPNSGGMDSSRCMPKGVSVTDCTELNDTSCSSTVQHCTTGDAFCNCEDDGNGVLTWHCAVYLGP